MLELAGVSSLPFAVGVYLPIQTSTPIFIGGVVRWVVDKIKSSKADDSESSPGVLLSSGYIAGGSIAGMVFAFMSFNPDWPKKLNLSSKLPAGWNASDLPALATFGGLVLILGMAGLGILFRATRGERRAQK
jgi:hypothetical protein